MPKKPLARAYIAKKVCSGRRENQWIEIAYKPNGKLGILEPRRGPKRQSFQKTGKTI